MVSSLSFLFASYPRLGTEEASNLEMPMDADKKALQKACLLFKRSGRGRLARQKTLFYTITSLLQPNTTENTAASPKPPKAKWGAWTSIFASL